MKLRKWLPQILLAVIVLVFFLLRIKGIIQEEVIYSYDQARDFLAGARIVINKDPVFIGPTTGIGGLFHGAWWYYIVAVTFLILGSDPINYYYIILLTQLISVLVFFYFGRKLLGNYLALLGSLNIAVAPYFISTSAFPSNHILAMPSFLLYCLSLGMLIKNYLEPKVASVQMTTFWFLVFGLSYGFVAEFELAFGILLAPTTIILILTTKEIRDQLQKRSNLITYILGITFPFIPRLLFEAKNGFVQTRLFLDFFVKPKLYTPRSYSDAFAERITNFNSYYGNAFANKVLEISFIAIVVLVAYFAIYQLYKKFIKGEKNVSETEIGFIARYVLRLALVLILLFVFSVGYRDTFWHYYYEGIQYGALLLSLGLCAMLFKWIPRVSKYIIGFLFVITSITGFEKGMNTLTPQRRSGNGLHLQRKIVQHIVNSQKSDPIFCARVYVPPVIPYTYDYLWLHHYLKRNVETPRFDFINDQCWYIVEPDQKGFEFRVEEWKKKNFPQGAVIRKDTFRSFNGIQVYRAELK